jgi:hypothetical protein
LPWALPPGHGATSCGPSSSRSAPGRRFAADRRSRATAAPRSSARRAAPWRRATRGRRSARCSSCPAWACRRRRGCSTSRSRASTRSATCGQSTCALTTAPSPGPLEGGLRARRGRGAPSPLRGLTGGAGCASAGSIFARSWLTELAVDERMIKIIPLIGDTIAVLPESFPGDPEYPPAWRADAAAVASPTRRGRIPTG